MRGVSVIAVGLMTIRLIRSKLHPPSPCPLAPKSSETMKEAGLCHRGVKFITHTTLHPQHTAFETFTLRQKMIIFLLLLGLLVTVSLYGWLTLFKIIVVLLTSLYFIDLLFGFFLIFRSLRKPPEIEVSDEEILNKKSWPTYSILCPLYKEWRVLPQFIQAISSLDYPKNKLDVILLLEEDDKQTINAARQMNLPSYFRILIVPHGFPKTKPKACNYGLAHAKGRYVVIYDAEDVPEPKQLKKAVLAFRKAGTRVRCVQAKLNFYNPHQNILTKLFTGEYSTWFDLILPGLQSIEAPIPLGGTSNYFRTRDLKLLEGWDGFNVTEDCDLGIRLYKRGYSTVIFNSTTMEEANSNLKNWFRQRSHWIKGYMQTYLVHMRRPGELLSSEQKLHFITFQLVVGGKTACMFINPFMWMTTAAYFIFRSTAGPFIQSLYPTAVLYPAVFCLIMGNFLYSYYYIMGCAKRECYELIKYVFFVPIYWLMMSLAGWHALYQLFFKPHYWEKTHHGLHLKETEEKKAELLSYPIPVPKASEEAKGRSYTKHNLFKN